MDFAFNNGTITKYFGSDTEVTIPDTINGQQVTKVGDDAFVMRTNLTSVNIPSSVTTIGARAFWNCESLTSVNIPSGVTTIEERTFAGCKSLTSVNIPSGVTTIEERTFAGCKSLTSVNIPSSVTTIGDDAFDECDALPSAIRAKIQRLNPNACDYSFSYSNSSSSSSSKSGGCYVATAVYGSYDCPQVWTLRRYRDFTLAESLFGRAFICVYYAVSPTLVKWFGKKMWFNHLWHSILNRKVLRLRSRGIEDTPYVDRVW